MMREGFAAVPNWVVRDSELSLQAVMVYVVLAAHQGPGGIYPSRQTIAREARSSVRSVANALNELEAAHLVERVKRTGASGQATSGYTLRPHGRLSEVESVEAPAALTGEVGARGALGEGTRRHSTPLIEEEPLKKKRTSRAGARISAEWVPSDALISWAQSHAPSVDPKSESETFVDYWLAAPGSKGVKSDWDATWRNWMRRTHSRNVERGWLPGGTDGLGREEWMLR